jgi:DNA-directed RNA polymerase specialized sigma24 family protein
MAAPIRNRCDKPGVDPLVYAYNRLRQLARRRYGRRQDWEDIASEAYVTLLKKPSLRDNARHTDRILHQRLSTAFVKFRRQDRHEANRSYHKRSFDEALLDTGDNALHSELSVAITEEEQGYLLAELRHDGHDLLARLIAELGPRGLDLFEPECEFLRRMVEA